MDKRNARVLLTSTWRRHAGWNHHIFEAVIQAFRRFPGTAVEVAEDYNLVSLLQQNPYDLVLVFGGTVREDYDFSAPASLCRRQGGRAAIWLTDDPYEFDVRHKFVDQFDYIFTNDRGCVDYYFLDDKVFYLPLAASKDRDYQKVAFPERRRLRKLLFCGAPYENRRLFISDLAKHIPPKDITLIGSGWDVDGADCMPEVRDQGQLMPLYKSSLFVLNIGRSDSIANLYNKVTPTTPGPRTFEIALAGVPQIFVADSYEIEDFYEPEEIIAITDAREVAQFLARAERDPQWWQSIALAAQKKTLDHHCYENRVNQIMSIIGKSRS